MSDRKPTTPYYGTEDGRVFKAPIEVQHDGHKTITLGFPVCKMLDYVGNDAAQTVAALMNLGAAGEEMLTALRGAMVIIETMPWPDHEASDGLRSAFDKRRAAIVAAIAKAERATLPPQEREP